MVKEWDLSPIQADQSPDPTEPPGRPMPPPVCAGAPIVAGTPAVGQVLATTNGSWANTSTSFGYRWRRDAKDIAGATAQGYVLLPADVGAMITSTVAGRNAGGAGSPRESSNTVGPITAAQ